MKQWSWSLRLLARSPSLRSWSRGGRGVRPYTRPEGRPGRDSRMSPARWQQNLASGRDDWGLGCVGRRRHCGHSARWGCGRRSGGRLRRRSDQSQRLSYFGVQLGHHIFVVLEELAGIFTSLADALALVAEPRAGLFKDVVVDRQIQQIAFARDAFPVEDVELGLAEWGGDFVLHDFDFGARASDDVAFFDGGDAPDIDADRRVELESAAAGGGLGIAEHHADLFANLVDKDQAGARFGNRSGQFAESLRHQASLRARVAVPHLAIEFVLGDERRDRVDYEHVDGVGSQQSLPDCQRLLAVVRLRVQSVVY